MDDTEEQVRPLERSRCRCTWRALVAHFSLLSLITCADSLTSHDVCGCVQVTRLLLEVVDVANKNGLKLPREFGLLLKQSLYFNRYTPAHPSPRTCTISAQDVVP